MAAFNFPNSPSVNDIHTENGVSWKWNGTIWKRVSSAYTDATNLHVTGLSTFVANAQFDANVSIGGTLTYEDVKNIDSVGVITARDKINMTQGYQLGWLSGSTNRARIHGDSGSNFIVETGSSNTERLRITSAGHLLHGVTSDEDTSGNGGLRFINTGDIQIDGDQKALVFRSTNNTAQIQSGIEWWNENGAGVQAKILCDRTAVTKAPSDIVFYTNDDVDTGANNSEGDITERLRITSAGKIGINESSPTSLLQITDGSSASTPFLHLKGANEHASIRLENTADNPDNVWQILPSISGASNTGFTIRDVTDSANRLVIDGTGKIGIGINAPARLLHLHEFGGIEAMIHFSTSATGTSASDGFRVGVNGSEEAIVWNNESGIIKFGTNNAERLRIDASGRVLIGTTTEGLGTYGEELTIGSSDHAGITVRTGTGHKGTIYFSDGTSGAAEYKGSVQYDHNDDSLRFASSGAEKLRIQSNGRVGVGTASARAFLDLCGAAENATLLLDSNDANANICLNDNTGSIRFLNYGGELAIRTGGNGPFTGDNEALRIDSSGRVLIGTSTPQGNGNADDLVVATSGTTGITIRSGTSNNGNLFFADGTSGADEYRGWVTYDHSQNHLTFGTNGQETFRAYSGRFGIGTASPTRTLEVRGPNDSHLAVTVPGTTQTSALLFGDSGDDDVGAISYNHSDNSMRFVTNTGERLRITNDGTLYSYSPDDATPNIALRSNDTNWHGYLTQTVHGGTISSILSCGGKWNVDGTTYSGTKDYNGSFPTCALVLHNQYNGSNGGHLVFLQKGSGSSTTDGTVTERLRIDQNGKLTVSSDSEPQVDVQATSAAGASMRVQSAGQYAYHMIVGSARHWRIGLPTGGTTFAIRDNTGGYNVLECNTIRSTKFLGSGTDVEIFPTDGMINYGMDGRNSYVTSTNGCYIFSGSGSSDGTTDLPAGTLVLQSRSNVDRDIVFATGSSPSEKLRIRRDGKIWKQSNQIYPVLKVQTITTNGSASLSGSGSWQTMHTLTIDPIKSGSKLWCHWQIQTWWGSTSDGSGDIYVKMDENSSGSWSTFFQNDRIAGNFDSDERRHHNTIDLVDTFPCSTASSFNIRLQAYASGNMGSANFNFFHTNSGNFFHFMEFDVA